MPSFEWRDPLLLLVALAAPLVYALAARLSSSLSYSTLAHLDAAPRSLRVRLARLPAALFAAATVVLAIALAGPRTGDSTSFVRREGIAIVMAVDRSGSMNARDFVSGDASVSRLDAVKHVFHDFVEGGTTGNGRDGDLIGLVVFGTFADGVCPLTLDHTNLLAILDDVAIASEASEASTALGEGLGLAVERLREHPAKSKVVILLTDGVSNAGEIDPMQAAQLAADHGIKVYTIAAGTNGLAPVPVTGPDGREYLRRVYVEMDEGTMKQIAEKTGGKYFHARDAAGLEQAYAEIDRLERSEISEVRYLQYREHYPPLVLAGLGLIAAAALAGATVLRRLP
ncbi:MAG: VWA domain-containing protein [Deltaproteobacteria bacterium]|nr:VWA domain-containing protein [Deltaproteobacteria bacterium]